MAQKDRNNITQAVNQNIYDNANKEILAAMVRDVLADYRDSFFNLKDDKLKDTKYEGNTTLEQHLANIVGRLPVFGTVEGIDVGSNQPDLTITGIIKAASAIKSGKDSLIMIEFHKSMSNRGLIPVLKMQMNEPQWNAQNDVCTPVIKRISGYTIHVALREVSSQTQNLTLEIIAL